MTLITSILMHGGGGGGALFLILAVAIVWALVASDRKES